jgi:hydrogenase maturation protein HypF
MAETRRYRIRGVVQGVGFRPFVFRAAVERSLGGWVRNDAEGVLVEAAGEPRRLEGLVEELRRGAPAPARVDSVELLERRPGGGAGAFEIRLSEGSGPARALIAADTAVCEECLRELLDPGDRRHLYPYVNCAACGPRYTIVRGVPYDRARTTMAGFPMCAACAAEFADPGDRRFHAQATACWDCGPRLRLRVRGEADDTVVDPIGAADELDDPIGAAARLLADGAIVAVKGLGGYHLMADARDEAAVAELRRRKRRERKPLALMSASLDAVRRYAEVGAEEAELLGSPARPILLLDRCPGGGVAEAVAPGNRRLGAMLAYTPVHHLLLRGELDTVVATSGNLAEEPIAFEDDDALRRLAPIADAFLLGERPIHTRADDSIARVTRLGGEAAVTPLRRARGHVPEPLRAPFEPPPLLAVGPQLKNTICLSRGADLFLSQHIGDLDNAAARRSFELAIDGLSALLEVEPELVAHDLHPDYASTAWALERSGLPTVAVQHHHAHLAACMCEHGLTGPVLGVVFDGAGYGSDGRIWGGELLLGDYAGFERAARLEYCPLPGGERAVREPFRVALALLHGAFGSLEAVEDLPVVARRGAEELRVLGRMIETGAGSPLGSSMGRLFDGVAALLGVREAAAYEAQAAIELEQLADPGAAAAPLAWDLHEDEAPLRIDPRPLVRELVAELRRGEAGAAELSARFHATVVDIVRRTCTAVRERSGVGRVALSGGVFQNELLLRGCHAALREAGFEVHAHRLVPPGDGGIALGQAAIAGWARRRT